MTAVQIRNDKITIFKRLSDITISMSHKMIDYDNIAYNSSEFSTSVLSPLLKYEYILNVSLW